MSVNGHLATLILIACFTLSGWAVPRPAHADTPLHATGAARLGLELARVNSPAGTAGVSLMAGTSQRTERGMMLKGPLPLEADVTLARRVGINEFRVETAAFAILFFGTRPVRAGSGVRFGVLRLERTRPMDRDLVFEAAAASGQLGFSAGGAYVFGYADALGVRHAERASSNATFTGAHLFTLTAELGGVLGDPEGPQLIPLAGGTLSSNVGRGRQAGLASETALSVWAGVDMDLSPAFAIRSRARYDRLSGGGTGRAQSRWRVQSTAHVAW